MTDDTQDIEELVVGRLRMLARAKAPDRPPRGFSENLLDTLLESLADAPVTGDATPAQRIHSTPPSRMRPAVAAAVAFVLVLVLGGVVVLVGPRGSERDTSSATSTPASSQPTATSVSTTTTDVTSANVVLPPPPTNPIGLVPSTVDSGETASFRATFPDGRAVYVDYPAGWQLAERGWIPATGLAVELEEPRSDGLGYLGGQLLFGLGDPVTVGGDGDVGSSITTGASDATVYSSRDPDRPSTMVIDFGRWIGTVFEAPGWSDSERLILLDHLAASDTQEGFVVVTMSGPLVGPGQDSPLSREVGSATLAASDDVLSLLSGCQSDPEYGPYYSSPEAVSWCDVDAGVAVTFHAPQHMHQTIYAQLDVRAAASLVPQG